MRIASSILAASCLLSLSQLALAQEGETFGAARTFAISWDIQHASNGGAEIVPGTAASGPTTVTTGGDTTTLTLAPALDYFVIDNLSIGGQLALVYESFSPANGGASQSLTAIGIGPRVGYAAPLGDRWSFWPKGGFTFATASSGGATDNVFSLDVYAPFLFHVAPHFFLGLGPNLDVQLSNSVSAGNLSASPPKETRFGAAFVVGGWW